MTIKDLKQGWESNNIPDDAQLNFMFEKSIPEDLLNLLDINLIFNYNQEENLFSIACIRKNYYTIDEMNKVIEHYENILNEYASKESNRN